MEIWLWISIGVLICIIAALFIKLLLMKKDVNEIETAFRDRISSETNTLIGISHPGQVYEKPCISDKYTAVEA